MRFSRRIVTPNNWIDVLNLLRPAMEKEAADPAAIYDELVTHRAQLWANDDLSVGCLTQSREDGVLQLYLVSGADIRAWLPDLMEAIAEGARAAGFKAIESSGRKAWVRLLAPSGYEPVAITLRKRL